jgi:hypothetical protein
MEVQREGRDPVVGGDESNPTKKQSYLVDPSPFWKPPAVEK